MATLAKSISAVCGALLIYVAVFLYADERNEIQNRLEKWWIEIRDLEKQGASKSTAFAHVIAGQASALLTRIFGRPLPSSDSVAMCTALTIMSLLLALIPLSVVGGETTRAYQVLERAQPGLYYGSGAAREQQQTLLYASLLVVWTGLLIGSIGFTARRRVASASILVVAVFQFAAWPIVDTAGLGWSTGAKLYFGLLGGLVAFGVAYIEATRRILTWIQRQTSLLRIVAAALLNPVVAVLVFLSSIMLANEMDPLGAGMVLIYCPFANYLVVLTSLAFLILAGTMLLHRVAWPILARGLYPIVDARVVAHRKSLFLIGLGLLGFAFPGVEGVLRKLLP